MFLESLLMMNSTVLDKQNSIKAWKKCIVKIPIIYTNGKSTKKLIEKLVKEKIKLNITAIFTLKQIKTILPSIKIQKLYCQYLVEEFMILVKMLSRFKNMNSYIKTQ